MKSWAFLCGYAVAGLLTFGHVFNANYVERGDCGDRPNSALQPEQYSKWAACSFPPFSTTLMGAGIPAGYVGAFWPLYWAGKVAIHITK